MYSGAQRQSRDVFSHKWHKQDTYESEDMKSATLKWLKKRYGETDSLFPDTMDADYIFLDAGCGSGYTTLEFFPHDVLSRLNYIGVDVSSAVDVAKSRFDQRKIPASFLQADINSLPFDRQSIDFIYSEGVLHHTDSTQRALAYLSGLLKPGGIFMFYVYNKKGPIREFTDDYIRNRLKEMPPETAWEALRSLTALGKTLGELQVEVDIEEDIPLLEIEKGKMDLQRFFYWHLFKVFYRPDFTMDEMQHINYDWYAPQNAHRQTPAQVRKWCGDAGLDVLREYTERSGISMVTRKK
ncbi:MAG: class I SAM-dependent methyltransferase [Desulfobacter sp.]|nr:MAG: class I SAM-dependent methyltransferase [Desulfobacter sp.]